MLVKQTMISILIKICCAFAFKLSNLKTNIQSKEKIIKNELQHNNIKILKEQKSDSKIVTNQIKMKKYVPEKVS